MTRTVDKNNMDSNEKKGRSTSNESQIVNAYSTNITIISDSGLTFFTLKFFLPIVLIYLFYLGIEDMDISFIRVASISSIISLLLFGIIVIYFVYDTFKVAWHIKSVSMDAKNLIVSNYISEIKVPFSDLKEVKQTGLMRRVPEYVMISIKNETKFGKTIIFIPKEKRSFSYWSKNPHPIVNELNALIVKFQNNGN